MPRRPLPSSPVENPRRSFESYGYRVFFLLLAALFAYRAIDSGLWVQWILVASFLAGVIDGDDFEKEWRWWVATLGCALLAGLVLYWLMTTEADARRGPRFQLAGLAGGLIAVVGILVSGRCRRVWSFTRPSGPSRAF